MNWTNMLTESVVSSMEAMLLISVIVIPILVGLEFLRARGKLNKITQRISSLTGKLHLPGEAAFPLVVSFIIGLQYGAGVVLQAGREGSMNPQELTITCIFIGITHALIEETIIFAGLGAYWVIALLARVLAGLMFAYIYVMYLKFAGLLPLR